MKKHLLFILCIANSVFFAQQWNWAKNAVGLYTNDANAVCTDSNGNVIVAGDFRSPLTIGSVTLANNGFFDMYVAKYDGSGNVLWAKCSGSTDGDFASSVTTDVNDNIIVAGYFASDSITFGTTTLINDTTDGTWDMFLVKYDTAGNVLWAKSAGGNSYDEANSVATDANNNIIVTGTFKSPKISFGFTTLNNENNSGSTRDLFIAKYDASGNMIWVKSAGSGGGSYDDARAVNTDSNGNIFVVGDFGSSITFGSITLNYGGMFIIKYDAAGNALWAKNAPGNANSATSVATDINGNVLIAGIFGSGITFGSTYLTGAAGSNIFLVKYDVSGNVIWAKSAGSNANEIVNSIATDANGNALLVGYFDGPVAIFGTITINDTDGGGRSLFVAKYDAAGNALWAISAGGSYNDVARSVATDANNNIFIGGTCYSSTVTLGTDTLMNSGYGGMFVGKMSELVVTNVPELIDQQNLSVYPNPSSGYISISCRRAENINIRNILGEEIMIKKVIQSDNEIKLDLSSQSKGIYFLEILSGNEKVVKKMVIQ